MPNDCLHNSAVLFELFKYVPIRLPEFTRFSGAEQKYVADVSAYLLRPDLLKGFCCGPMGVIGPQPVKRDRIATYSVPIGGNVAPAVHLRNDPEDLKDKNWRIPDSETEMGGELFRSLSAAVYFMTYYGEFTSAKPDKYLGLGHMMIAADVVAYLLDPKDLTDYVYSEAEIAAFHKTLEGELRTV